jgi:hypothetical protein
MFGNLIEAMSMPYNRYSDSAVEVYWRWKDAAKAVILADEAVASVIRARDAEVKKLPEQNRLYALAHGKEMSSDALMAWWNGVSGPVQAAIRVRDDAFNSLVSMRLSLADAIGDKVLLTDDGMATWVDAHDEIESRQCLVREMAIRP